MGSGSTEKDRYEDEGPRHQVTISAFEMMDTEVTVSQFSVFVDSTDYVTEAERTTCGEFWVRHVVDEAFEGTSSVHAEDIDDDGDIDIIASAVLGSIGTAWWENVGSDGELWRKQIIDHTWGNSNYGYTRDICTTNIDGDGDIDVLCAKSTDRLGEIIWWEQVHDLEKSWTKHSVDYRFPGVHTIIAKDIDSDGDIDILGASKTSENSIVWWENNDGLGMVWIKHIVDSNFDHAWTASANDIDNDNGKINQTNNNTTDTTT